MKVFLRVFFFFFIPLVSFGQEKSFYVVDNSYHEIFRKHKVKSLKIYTTLYQGKTPQEKFLEAIQEFDKKGNIIGEREFYQHDTTDGWEVKHTYNKFHKIVKTKWTWLDDNSTELTEYEYGADGKLIESCDYVKHNDKSDYKLLSCQTYIYKNNIIQEVISMNKTILYYYKSKNGVLSKFNSRNELEAKYKNGETFYRDFDSRIFTYESNHIGQIIRSIASDRQGKIVSETHFIYSEQLLMQVITKNHLGNITNKEEYFYEYYK